MVHDWLCGRCYSESKLEGQADKETRFSANYELQIRTFRVLETKVRKIKQSYKTLTTRRKNKLKALDAEIRAKTRELADLEGQLAAASEELERKIKTVAELALVKRPERYPDIPPPALDVTEQGDGLPDAAGIYFIWKAGRCVYVGQSLSLQRRCSLGHERIREGESLSFVCLDPYELTWAECFYIGVLRPRRNFGNSASHNKFPPPQELRP